MHEQRIGLGYHAAISSKKRGTRRLSYDPTRFAACAQAIAAAGRKLGAQGLTPATSSNFSMRLDSGHVAVTISGGDKGLLTPADIMEFTLEGDAVDARDRKPYLERFIHGAIYEARPDVQSVVPRRARSRSASPATR